MAWHGFLPGGLQPGGGLSLASGLSPIWLSETRNAPALIILMIRALSRKGLAGYQKLLAAGICYGEIIFHVSDPGSEFCGIVSRFFGNPAGNCSC